MRETVPARTESQNGHEPRSYSGVGAAERVAARRQRFVEAGIELFGTAGFHATTVRMLTAEAGLTNRYFYESFASTEDLLIACYEQLITEYRTRLKHVLDSAEPDLEARARAGLTCFFDAMRDPKFARITHNEILGVSPRVDALYTNSSAEFAAMMMDYLARGGAPIGSHDPKEMKILGAALAGAVIHAATAWIRSQYATPVDVVVQAMMKVLLGSVEQLSRHKRKNTVRDT